jgi:uncharacterized protein (DUF58 family)
VTSLVSKLTEVDFFVRWYVSQLRPGRHLSRFRGAGLELDTLAPYEPGDDPRWINWAATARTGGTITLKSTRIEERELSVFLAVDLSASMLFGTQRASKRRITAELAAALAHAAWRMNDPVGFAGYASRVVRAWPPRCSARDRLLIPAIVLGRAGEGCANLAAVVGRLPRRRALVFVLSDFQDDPGLDRALTVMSRRHDVVPVVVEDPGERCLPNATGLLALRDLETGAERSVWVDGRTRAWWLECERRREDALMAAFRRAGVDSARVDPTGDPLREIVRVFLDRRERLRCGPR